ncbi:DUF4402 domain-containing protein [Pseudoalteromonas luteoviolacea]|uniref:DUF4402 domain-containing protein n=1 Tax=Pseudoalteromonas luteoviolacea S4060-1 TaxID=1365257 RepID=A0A167MQN9_9GAMM|nr:DUF4402 domain-containing protein [Pseudoalteromonas luteoviolacea]KZN66797.1 hypothetical protein N478_18345 [Pseudoalteromonas luteoviolacea S4060-1]
MKNKTRKIALVTALAAVALTSNAGEQRTFEAKVTVKNAFELEKQSDLLFGTIRARADTTGSDTATLVIPADTGKAASVTSTNISNAEISILEAGAPAQFKISGVVPFATLTITDPVETNIVLAGGNPNAAGFTMDTFTYYIETGALSKQDITGNKIQVDDKGEALFNIGATLKTTTGGTANYLDGSYSGTFTIEVSY